jgi:hypothetical protein
MDAEPAISGSRSAGLGGPDALRAETAHRAVGDFARLELMVGAGMAPAEPGRVVGEPARGVPVRGCFVAGPVRDLRLPQQACSNSAPQVPSAAAFACRRSWLTIASVPGSGFEPAIASATFRWPRGGSGRCHGGRAELPGPRATWRGRSSSSAGVACVLLAGRPAERGRDARSFARRAVTKDGAGHVIQFVREHQCEGRASGGRFRGISSISPAERRWPLSAWRLSAHRIVASSSRPSYA